MSTSVNVYGETTTIGEGCANTTATTIAVDVTRDHGNGFSTSAGASVTHDHGSGNNDVSVGVSVEYR
jgi:hypothetical protein